MYTKVCLTLLLMVMTAVAVELWRPRRVAVDQHLPMITEVALLERVHGLDLRGLTRETALDQLKKQTSATLVVDWRSLAGYTAAEEVAFRAEKLDGWVGNVTLDTALKIVLGPGATFQVDGNVTKVTGNEQLGAEEMTVRAYDIGDLVSDAYWRVPTPPGQESAVIAARANRIRDVVTQHALAPGWHINYVGSGNPGGSASISVLGTSLIATQSTDGHWAVAQVLQELRHPTGDASR